MAFSWKERQAAIDECRVRPTELLIVGGGVVGCSIAAHAALLGLDCVLVERADFASGASGNSTGLAHAGLRYLAQGRLRYVFLEARERLRLEQLAPHWVQPFPFLFPVHRRDRFGLGLIRLATAVYAGLYRLAAIGLGIPLGRSYRMLTAEEILRRIPGLDPEGLTGGTEYFVDARLADSRFTLGFAQLAANLEARIINHATLVSWTRDQDRLTGGIVRDEIGQCLFPVHARQIVNATGAWIDEVRDSAGLAVPLLRNSKGIHLLVDRISDTAVILSGETPGQVLFVIPMERDLSLVGTTDAPYTGPPDLASWTGTEVEQLVRSLFRFFPRLSSGAGHRDSAAAIDRYRQAHVHAIFWGLRPLIRAKAGSTLQASRDHRLFKEPNGLWSVPGVKLTAARRAGEQVAREAWKALRRCPIPRRRLTSLPGGDIENLSAYVREVKSQHGELSLAQLTYLIECYGTCWTEVLHCADRDVRYRSRVLEEEPWIYAEAIYAAHREMVLSLNDFLWRRTEWAHLRDLPDSTVWRVAKILGKELGWSPEDIRDQVEGFRRENRARRPSASS